MSADGAATRALVGKTFRVAEIDGVPTLGAPSAELELGSDGRVTGRATINRVFGPYSLDGDTLTFGALGTTMMAGLPEAMDQEQRLLRAMSGPLVVEAGPQDRVTLRTEDRAVLVLEPATVIE